MLFLITHRIVIIYLLLILLLLMCQYDITLACIGGLLSGGSGGCRTICCMPRCSSGGGGGGCSSCGRDSGSYESSDDSGGLYGASDDGGGGGIDYGSSMNNYPVAASDTSGTGSNMYQESSYHQPALSYVASNPAPATDSYNTESSYKTPSNLSPSGYQSSGGTYEMSASYPSGERSYTVMKQSSGSYALAASGAFTSRNQHQQQEKNAIVLHFSEQPTTTPRDPCEGNRCFTPVLEAGKQVCTGETLGISHDESISSAALKCALLRCEAANAIPNDDGTFNCVYLRSVRGRTRQPGTYCVSGVTVPNLDRLTKLHRHKLSIGQHLKPKLSILPLPSSTNPTKLFVAESNDRTTVNPTYNDRIVLVKANLSSEHQTIQTPINNYHHLPTKYPNYSTLNRDFTQEINDSSAKQPLTTIAAELRFKPLSVRHRFQMYRGDDYQNYRQKLQQNNRNIIS